MFSTRHQHGLRSVDVDGLRPFGPALSVAAALLGVFLNAAPSNAQEPVEFKGHQEVVYDAKFLPDGKSLVTASFDQTLKLWDIATQATLRTMEGHTGIVLTVDVSPDGKLIASGSSDRTIRLWDVPNSDPVSTTQVSDTPITAMATSRDGLLTATGDASGLIRIRTTVPAGETAENEKPGEQKPVREISIGRPVSRLAWRNDNQKLAAACDDGSLIVVSLAANGEFETGRLGAHQGVVTGVVFSPNNQFIFSCGADGFVRRWPSTIPNAQTFDGLPKAATSVDLHPNGSLIVVVGEDGSAKILKRADGSVVQNLEGHTGRITGAVFNGNGSQVATIGADQIARVFDVGSGKNILETATAKSALTAVLFSTDGKDVVVGTERGEVFAHALNNEPPRFRVLSKRPEAVQAVVTTSDGSRILFGGDDKRLWIREAATEKTVRGAEFDAGVTALAISKDNATLAVGLANGAIAIVDAAGLQQSAMLLSAASSVSKIAFNTSGTQLVSSSRDGTVRLWDLKAQAIAQTFAGADSTITDVAFQNDNKSIVTVDSNGKVRVETIAVQIVHRADDGSVNDIAIASNGSQYATAGADGTVKLWNASNSTPTRSFTGFEGPAVCVSLSSDNRQIAAGGSDQTVRTWDLNNANGHFRLTLPAIPRRVSYCPDSTRLITSLADNSLQCFDPTPLNPQPAEPPDRDASQVLRGHTAVASDVAWSADSQTLWTGSTDMTVREWSIALPKEKSRLSGHSLQVYSVVFSPDGETIASASADKTVRLWNLQTGRAIKTLATLPAAVYGLDFSSDGKQIVVAAADGTVRLLDVDNGRTIREFTGPEHAIYTVDLSKDNNRIAAAGMGVGSERKVFLWSIDSSEPSAVLPGHADDVYRVQFNSTGSRLLSIGYSGSLRIWNVDTGKSLLEQDSGIVSYSGEYSPDDSRIAITSNDRTARLITLPDSTK